MEQLTRPQQSSNFISLRLIRHAFLAAFLPLLFTTDVFAQLSVSISSPNNSINSCGPRTLNVTVSGGSGNYQYFWNSNPASGATIANAPSITVSPTV